MKEIVGKHITTPIHPGGDGISCCDGEHYNIKNCCVDFTAQPLDNIDEALGVTWGSTAIVTNSYFVGAGKLILCGSGDEDKIELECGKSVLFKDCTFSHFGRRGPEVQDGMEVILENCLICNWGAPDRFTVRSFGAWAHGKGSRIIAYNCIFWQDYRFGRHWFQDMIGHIGQAWNDSGVRGLFSKDAWRPGNCRGLVASDGGYVEAHNCYRNHDWIVIENCKSFMDESEVHALAKRLWHDNWFGK